MEQATFISRHGENDFSVWFVDVPVKVADQVRAGQKENAPDLRTLLIQMQTIEEYPPCTMCRLERSDAGYCLTVSTVTGEFLGEYSDHGASVRGTLEHIIDELIQ